MAAVGARGVNGAGTGATVDSAAAVQEYLDVLGDPDCRAILGATGDEALSASELADACDVPLSTVYRKLDVLTDADLLAEATRLRRSGKHVSEYRRCVDDVTVSGADDGGFKLELASSQRTSGGAAAALSGW